MPDYRAPLSVAHWLRLHMKRYPRGAREHGRYAL